MKISIIPAAGTLCLAIVFMGLSCTVNGNEISLVPKLDFRLHIDEPLVVMTFPERKGATFEAWCYESKITLVGMPKIDEDGVLVLLHRSNDDQSLLIETTVTPSPGSVSIVARALVDRKVKPEGELPEKLPYMNVCFQESEAEGFRSRPGPYPEFVKRHFIFTENGQTFLMDIPRTKVPSKPSDHVHNNPPWVQLYTPAWHEPTKGAGDWAGYSPAQYIVPVIGTVSRDGKHLVALANNGSCANGDGMCNAWHDCLHANPLWSPKGISNKEKRSWQLNIYFLENDSDALLKLVEKDFPAISKLSPLLGSKER